MKKEVVVFLLMLLVMPVILAGNVNISYPASVLVGDEFDINVELINFSEDIYDIKFEILNGSQNIAQRYWENEWKSTNYWMNDFINISEVKEKIILLKIVDNYNGTNSFGVKVRDSDGDIFEFDDYPLNISFIEVVEEENSETEIYYELDWDEEDIENGNNFKIDVEAYNLKDYIYDVRLWIELEENETIISEIYDRDKEKWLSGNYYINDIFEGPGNESDKIKIRIKEKYEDFYGDARIYFKLRDEEKWYKKIVILEKSNSVLEENHVENEVLAKSSKESLEEPIERDSEKRVIKLGQKVDSIETEDLKVSGNIIYESKTHKIKKYSVYFFTLLIVVFCVLVILRKLE